MTLVRYILVAACVSIGALTISATETAAQDVRALADTFERGDLEGFKADISPAPIEMFERDSKPTRMTPDEFISRVKDCSISMIFVAGENEQSHDGISWVCNNEPFADAKCRVVGYSADISFRTDDAANRSEFVVSPLWRTKEWDARRCGAMRPALPPTPKAQ